MHQATKSKMRFFTRKKTQDRKGTTQQLKPIISSGTESSSSAVENRTDIAIKKQQDGTREKTISANAAAESKKVVRSPKKSPRTSNTNKPAQQTSNNNNRTTTKTPIIEKKEKASTSPKKQQQQSTTKKAPVSILHKNRHTTAKQDAIPSDAVPTRSTGFTFASPPAPQDTSPYHNRVRFLSSGSAASTEASQVHLMGLGGHSVASSSAMSSSADHPRENVFDRVLNMVMKEENVRLNAMGMSSYGAADPESMRANITPAASKAAAKKKQDRADAKAKKAIAKLGIRSSSSKNRDLGLSPPGRTDLAPIDMDTGLEIGANFDAPIDMDTGLEVQYHDLNDDDVDEERWQKLNDAAKLSSKLSANMKGLNVKKSRSYDHKASTPKSSPTNRFRRSNSGGGGSSKVKRSSPNKKEKDEWVAFDSPSSPSIKDRMRRSLQGKSHPDEEAF